MGPRAFPHTYVPHPHHGTISSSCLQNVSHGQGGNDGAGIAAILAINTDCAKQATCFHINCVRKVLVSGSSRGSSSRQDPGSFNPHPGPSEQQILEDTVHPPYRRRTHSLETPACDHKIPASAYT